MRMCSLEFGTIDYFGFHPLVKNMAISFTCPHCHKPTNVADEYAGATGPCRSCQRTITIPGAAGAFAEPMATPGKSKNRFLLPALIAGSALVIVPVLMTLLLLAVNAARESARRNTRIRTPRDLAEAVINHQGPNICVSNHQRIASAMLKYEATNGHLPPAYTVDENGRLLHSWRVLILPFLEEMEIYDQIDLTKPWNDPANLAVTQGKMPDVYRCPSDEQVARKDYTNYVVVVDANSAFPPGGKEIQLQDIRYGLSGTLGVVETAGPGVFWAEPTDITLPELKKLGSDHARGIVIGSFLDAHVATISLEKSRDELKAMIDRADSARAAKPRADKL